MDILAFLRCLEFPNASQFFCTVFKALLPFNKFTFSAFSYPSYSFFLFTLFYARDAMRMLNCTNAGGSSDNSEALSFDILHRLFGAELLKAEMEVKYVNSVGKKTDYLARIGNHKIGVSVTRAMEGTSSRGFFEKDAFTLLRKKLFDILVSTRWVVDEDAWERQILHVFVQNQEIQVICKHVYQSLHPIIRADTIVICTVAGNENWIFHNTKLPTPSAPVLSVNPSISAAHTHTPADAAAMETHAG